MKNSTKIAISLHESRCDTFHQRMRLVHEKVSKRPARLLPTYQRLRQR